MAISVENSAFASHEGAFLARFAAAIDAEPIEDGECHPVDEMVLEFAPESDIAGLMDRLCQPGGASYRASFLLALGRTGVPRNSVLRWEILSRSLDSNELVVRDAAAQAAEMWADASVVPLLVQHQEAVPWLSQYIAEIAEAMA